MRLNRAIEVRTLENEAGSGDRDRACDSRIERQLKGRVSLTKGLCRLASALVILALLVTGGKFARAQEGGASSGGEAPAAPARKVIRFVTDADYPPFNYYDEDGALTGFNVDVARAVCLALNVTCDIQVQPWDTHYGQLRKGETDAVIASQKITPQAVREFSFTDRYYFTPARFVSRRGFEKSLEIRPRALEGRKVGVRKGSAHEAYLHKFFRDCVIEAFETDEAARAALKAGRIELLFGDAISISFWINGTASQNCCEFRGEAFFDPLYFGDGIAIAVRKEDDDLLALLDKALVNIRRSGRMEELALRYFPLRPY